MANQTVKIGEIGSSMIPDGVVYDPTEVIEPEFKKIGFCSDGCPVCGGLGYVRVAPNAEPGDPDFGKVANCPRANVPVTDKYIKDTGLKGDEFDLKWDVIQRNWYNVSEAVDAVSETLDRGYGWVYLWGQYGMAKTLILKIAVAMSLHDGKRASYTSLMDILAHLRSVYGDDTIQNGTKEEENRLAYWQNVDVLAIDELEVPRVSDYAYEKRFQLFDARYVHSVRGESVTLIAGNRNPEEIDPKLYDRIVDGRNMVVKLEGKSMRKYISTGVRY